MQSYTRSKQSLIPPQLLYQLAKIAGVPMLVKKKLVELAFELHNFLHETGPRFLKELGIKPAEFVVFVMEQYLKPAQATRSQIPTRPTYPTKWIDNRVDR